MKNIKTLIALTVVLTTIVVYGQVSYYMSGGNPSGPFIQSIGGGNSSGGSGITNLPVNALGGLWNDGAGSLSWLTAPAISLANVSAGTLPPSAASTAWPPATNAVMTTNNPIASRSGQVPVMTGNTNQFGAPTANVTNLQFYSLEFHMATNAFTNVVLGYFNLTNYDGRVFQVLAGTNLP